MSNYGVTEKGFILKRIDTILEELHTELTEGFGIDTRRSESSFLQVLITTFASQIAQLWETAQDSYYAKFPATATNINLDHAVQYGGIRRAPNKRTCYPLHCTGEDGIYVREGVVVATNTMPEVKLYAAEEFQITRKNFNEVQIKVAAIQKNSVYTITINGSQFNFLNIDGTEVSILEGIKSTITDTAYLVTVDTDNNTLIIKDTQKARGNILLLSENLTTSSVTTIANFYTQDYGKIMLPNGIVTKMIQNIPGFIAVVNKLIPTYGRQQETDIELRQSYLAKSALRSNTMIDSIIAELLNNVANVESVSGYENDSDSIDDRGLPPHSIEIVVEGGKENEIAQAILRRKAGGIQTYGMIVVPVLSSYGDTLSIKFNRPEYLYVWLKVTLHGDAKKVPINYSSLTIQSIIENRTSMVAGTSLLTQLLHDNIYKVVAGITYIEIETASSTDSSYVPSNEEYKARNIIVSSRQKVLLEETRIEVIFCANP